MDEPDTRTPFRRLLDDRGVSVVDAAEAMGIHFTQLYRYAGGSVIPRVDTAARIVAYAKTLDPSVTMDSLFGGGAS